MNLNMGYRSFIRGFDPIMQLEVGADQEFACSGDWRGVCAPKHKKNCYGIWNGLNWFMLWDWERHLESGNSKDPGLAGLWKLDWRKYAQCRSIPAQGHFLPAPICIANYFHLLDLRVTGFLAQRLANGRKFWDIQLDWLRPALALTSSDRLVRSVGSAPVSNPVPSCGAPLGGGCKKSLFLFLV